MGLIAGLAIGLGSWATTGSTDVTHTAWFRVAVVIATVAVVLAVVGGVGAFLTRSAGITDGHSDTLKRALDAAAGCIEQGVACEYGYSPRDVLGRDFFLRHFKGLKLKKRWEPVVQARKDSESALLTRLESEAAQRGIAAPAYDVACITTAIHVLVIDSARGSRPHRLVTFNWGGGEEPSGRVVGAPIGDHTQDWIKVASDEAATSDERMALARDRRDKVNQLLADAQTWAEARAVDDASTVLALRRRELLREIVLIRERWPPAAAWRCPGCG